MKLSHEMPEMSKHEMSKKATRRRGARNVMMLGAMLLVVAPARHNTARADYRAKAEETTDFIQKTFYDAAAGLYRPAVPADPKGLPYEVMWGNGVQVSALVGGTRHNPRKYRPLLDSFTRALDRYWDKDAPTPGYDAYFASRDNDDKYYDDNAWLVLAFGEAFEVTRNRDFLERARRTQRFVLSGWDNKLDGGVYWYQNRKTSKNTCVNAPAATAALQLYQLGTDRGQLPWARRIVAWTRSRLQDKTDGLYWDNINLEGRIEKTKWTYNTALMIRAHLELWRTTKNRTELNEARRLGDAAIKAWVDPLSGALANNARFNHLLSEALLELYKATRDVRYLNVVRRDADFAYRHVRDAQNGGYWTEWKNINRAPGERKLLIENASVARLFWLLAPYPDVEQLNAQAETAARAGNWRRAVELYRQAVASTSGIAAVSTGGAATSKAN